MAATTSAKILANVFDLTPSRVHQLVKEGLPKENRGQFDLLKCVRWYVKYLHNVIEKKAVPIPGEGFAGEREERIRLLRADADLREMELAKERALVISISDYERTLADLILTTKARIMAIPPRVAPDVTGQTSRVMVQALIEKACKEALGSLARMENAGSPDSPKRDG